MQLIMGLIGGIIGSVLVSYVIRHFGSIGVLVCVVLIVLLIGALPTSSNSQH